MANIGSLSTTVVKPALVPDSVVDDFVLFTEPAHVADSKASVLDLTRNAPPVFWTLRHCRHWIRLSHESNFSATRDLKGFSTVFASREPLKAMEARMPRGTPHHPIPQPILFDLPNLGHVDPMAFVELETDKLKPKNKTPTAFNAGPLRGLCSHPARIALRIVNAEILSRLPRHRLDTGQPASYRGGEVIGEDPLHRDCKS